MSAAPENFFAQFDTPQAAAPPPPSNAPQNYFAQFDPPHPVAGPSGDWATDVDRRGGTALADAIAGIRSFPRTIAHGVDWAGRQIGVEPGAEDALASVSYPNSPTQQQVFPDFQTAKNDAYDLTGGTEYKPATTLGGYLQTGLTAGMGGALAGGPQALLRAPTQIPGAIARLGGTIPAAVGGGTVGAAAADVAPENWKIPAALAGFVLGAKTTSGAANTASRLVSLPFSNGSDLYQAYKAQGIPTTLAGDVTQNPGLQFAQSMASKMPGGEDMIRAASEKAVNAWQDAVMRASRRLGPASTMEDSGRSLVGATEQWLGNFKNQNNSNWSSFRSVVPPTTPINVGGFQTALGNVLQDFGGADNLAGALQPKLAGTLKLALGKDLAGGDTLPWQSVQAIRSRLGEMLEGGQPIDDMALSAVKRLYGGLSDDMRAGAAAQSPKAGRLFDAVSAYTRAGHELLDDHLRPILNATNPEEASRFALSQMGLGGSRLAAIDQAMPGQGANLGAGVLQRAGENGIGKYSPTLNRISPEAQSVLFGPAQQDVGQTQQIADAMKATGKMANHSNTAVTEARTTGRLIAAREFAEAGREMFGLPGGVAGAAVGAFSPELIGTPARIAATNPILAKIYATPPAVPMSRAGMLNPIGTAQRLPLLTGPAGPQNSQ